MFYPKTQNKDLSRQLFPGLEVVGSEPRPDDTTPQFAAPANCQVAGHLPHADWQVPDSRAPIEPQNSGALAEFCNESKRVPSPWAHAWTRWLATKSPNTRRAYRRAWRDLLNFTQKPPQAILSADIQAWLDHLHSRPLNPTVLKGLQPNRRPCRRPTGLSPATINQYLAAISSFYAFTRTAYTIPTANGHERPLHTANPALTVQRPSPNPNGSTGDYLDARHLARLLRAIPRHTPAGQRDYALFLGYILTGRRNSEWRTLTWGHLRARANTIYYTWTGKNTSHAKNQLPPPVWQAIRNHLEASQRLEGIRPEHHIFCPLTDRATRLPNIPAASWTNNRPLSAAETNRLLKKHARRAGLDAPAIHVHTLRHSAAMLEDQLGSNLTRIAQFLGHTDPKTTIRYLNHLRGRPDPTWQDKAQLLHLDSPPPAAHPPAERT